MKPANLNFDFSNLTVYFLKLAKLVVKFEIEMRPPLP